jgi:protein-S-isoprenylcysteine O-methyltransferase Ste14
MAEPPSKLIAVPAPVLYLAAFLAGLALDRVGGWWIQLPVAGKLVSLMLIALGAVIGPGSAIAFALKRTTLNPAGEPTRLVTGGVYRWTRNPMYLGLALIYVGLALFLGAVGPLILLPAPLLFLNGVVIPFEEAQLRARFGESFTTYCSRVRRWA